MANDPKKNPARDRTRDVEALAATLFAQGLSASKGAKTPDHLAREAVSTARVFYAALDAVPDPDRAPPG